MRHLPFANWYCTDCHLFNDDHLKNPAVKVEFVTKREQLCQTCHRTGVISAVGEEGLITEHEPWRQGFCTDCHNPHAGKGPELLRTDKISLCTSCHRLQEEMSGMNSQHQPFTQGECTACHSPHASQYPGMTRMDTGSLCSTCHVKHVLDLAMPYRHGPFGAQDCTYCHNPHANNGQSLLDDYLPVACYKCHPQVREEMLKPFGHQPVKSGQCQSCHRPHGAMQPALLAVDGCTGCHVEFLPAFFAPGRHPVGTPGFSSANCHRGHGAENRYLLTEKGNSVCSGCHDAIVRSTMSNKHNRVAGSKPAGDCLNCHQVHYSNFPSLLPADRREFCITCHGDTQLQVMDASHSPAIREGRVMCADCHTLMAGEDTNT